MAPVGSANENNVALLRDEHPAREIANKGVIDRRASEVEVVEILSERHRERAFPLIASVR